MRQSTESESLATDPIFLQLVKRIERNAALDPWADTLRGAVQTALPPGPVRELLRGNWLGHAFHPLLSDFVEGPWMAASFLDLFGPEGSEPAARRLLGFGLLVAGPAYVTGLLEWAEEQRVQQRRVGLVHLGSITTAISLYSLSYLVRRRGGRGRLLGVVAGVVAMGDGYVAGHMSHVRKVATGELHLVKEAQ
ncbi:MAG TPA: hypothetical protein VHJ78_11170 [Actinomycetota bacterium]|nr:hypothetical protein [Actinomycetota bacterium]